MIDALLVGRAFEEGSGFEGGEVEKGGGGPEIENHRGAGNRVALGVDDGAADAAGGRKFGLAVGFQLDATASIVGVEGGRRNFGVVSLNGDGVLGEG